MTKEPLVAPPPDCTHSGPAPHSGSSLDAIRGVVEGTFAALTHYDNAAEAVLNKLNRGIVIFDFDARVDFQNNAAMYFTHDRNPIEVTDGRLKFTDNGAQARFTAYLTRCSELANCGAEPAAVVMRIAAGLHRPPFRVLLSPLRTQARQASSSRDSLHVLMIYEPNAGQRLPRRILTELYGLSEAEADLTLRLFAGESLETASQLLHISINTAKTQAHHIFRKCDVHSQGELLQLLSLGPRTL